MPGYECPICRKRVEVDKPEEAPHRPFCSRRCKLVDLGKWLNEEYRVTEEASDPDARAEEEGDDPSERR